VKYYFRALRKYAVFKGRSTRSEYWFFTLFNVIFAFIFSFIDKSLGLFVIAAGFGPLSAIYTLAVMTPGVAVSVRRLHDIGRSGFWFLITAIPVVGLLAFIYFAVQPSDGVDNKYGPVDKI